MLKEGLDIRGATSMWVHEMNAIPQEIISILMDHDPDSWQEVTAPRVSDRVYVFDSPGSNHCGSIIAKNNTTGVYKILLDDGREITTDDDTEFVVEYYDNLPMWGTMWSFGDSCDDYWLENDDGIQKMSSCGFRIYESDDFGYFFGIDGAGYDFYESHWCPLYRKRGLQWHDPDTEKEDKE